MYAKVRKSMQQIIIPKGLKVWQNPQKHPQSWRSMHNHVKQCKNMLEKKVIKSIGKLLKKYWKVNRKV